MPNEDTPPGGLIIDELLCFVMNKFDKLDCETMVRLCVETYTCGEIEQSKKQLFEALKDENDVTQFKKRRSYKSSDSKQINNMGDIYQLLQEKGSEHWPTYVASDLNKLPPITFDHIDVTALLTNLQNVKTDVDMLKQGLKLQCETSDSLKEINAKLQDRLIQLELIQLEPRSTDNSVVTTDVTVAASEGGKPFPCSFCDYSSGDEENLFSHIVACHADAADQQVAKSNNGTNIDSTDKEIKMFSCSECNFKFMTQEGLQEHFVTHNMQYKVCNECREQFNSNDELSLHMESHKQEHIFSCSECDYKSTSKDILNKHNLWCCVKKQTNNQTLSQGENSKESLNSLGDSVSTNNKNLKMFACSECGYRYMTKEGLQKHFEIHTKEKVYNMVCGECKEGFKSENELLLHMQRHQQSQAFPCIYCM